MILTQWMIAQNRTTQKLLTWTPAGRIYFLFKKIARNFAFTIVTSNKRWNKIGGRIVEGRMCNAYQELCIYFFHWCLTKKLFVALNSYLSVIPLARFNVSECKKSSFHCFVVLCVAGVIIHFLHCFPYWLEYTSRVVWSSI